MTKYTTAALGLLLLGACSESRDDAPFEWTGRFVSVDGPSPGSSPAPSLRIFFPDGEARSFRIQKGEAERWDLSSPRWTWVQGSRRGDELQIRDLFVFPVDRASELPAAGQLGTLKFSSLLAQGGCNHMPTDDAGRGCRPQLSAELRILNTEKVPVDCTLERAFVSFAAGDIGVAVRDFVVTSDRAVGSVLPLASGAESRAVVALPPSKGRTHGESVYVALVFAVGPERLILRGAGKISIAQ